MNTVKNRFRADLVEDGFVNSYYVESKNLADLKAYLKTWGDMEMNRSYPELYNIIFRNFDRTYFVDLESYLNNDPRLSSDPVHFIEYDAHIPYEVKLDVISTFLTRLKYDLKFQTPINDIELSKKMYYSTKTSKSLTLLEKATNNTEALHNIKQKISDQFENHSTKIKK